MVVLIRFLRIFIGLAAVLALMGFAAGCARPAKEVKPDPFFEKWKTLAETSKGSSSSSRTRSIDLAGDHVVNVPESAGEKEKQPLPVEPEPEQALPTMPVTLKLIDVKVGLALRALGKMADQDLMVNTGEGSHVSNEISVNVNSAPWDKTFLGILKAHGLRHNWEGSILRVVTTQDMEKDLRARKMQEQGQRQKIVAKSVEPLIMKVVKIDYADPAELVLPLNNVLSIGAGSDQESGKEVEASKNIGIRGSVALDKHSNSLILMATREELERMLALIDKLDIPPCQVHIQANIVETTRDTARDLGIQWGGMYGRYNALDEDIDMFITPGGTGGQILGSDARGAPFQGLYTPLAGTTGLSGQGSGVNFPVDLTGGAGASLGLIFGKIGSKVLEIQLSALAKQGKINILSTPSITTLDNQMAFTENGKEVPYVSVGENGEREVKFKDATLKLEITPHVINDTHLKMKVDVKKDEVDLANNVDGNPFIYKKQTKTNLIVRNGETIVISGLTKSTQTDRDSGVPWLKDVPGLGWMFKGESRSKEMAEVLIFLTPTVLPNEPDDVVKKTGRFQKTLEDSK